MRVLRFPRAGRGAAAGVAGRSWRVDGAPMLRYGATRGPALQQGCGRAWAEVSAQQLFVASGRVAVVLAYWKAKRGITRTRRGLLAALAPARTARTAGLLHLRGKAKRIARSRQTIHPWRQTNPRIHEPKLLNLKNRPAAWSASQKQKHTLATQPCKQDALEGEDTSIRGAEAAMMHPSEG